jgi:predicted nuclease of predicted toxin-antitoxin system
MSEAKTNIPRLLLDECVWAKLASNLRSEGFDALHVIEVGISGVQDDEILQYATDNGRAVLTFNVKDFILLAKQWYVSGKPHAGIVVSNQLQHVELQKRIKRLLRKVSESDLANNLIFLQDYK